MARQQSRDQPEEKSSHQQATVNSVSKEIVEQPGYSLRPAEDRDHLAEQQPDSLEEQDDRPEVECMDLDSSENIELAYIDDAPVPEDDLEVNDETTLAEEKTPERPDNTAKKKREFIFQYKVDHIIQVRFCLLKESVHRSSKMQTHQRKSNVVAHQLMGIQ